jgi:hypothetical protein
MDGEREREKLRAESVVEESLLDLTMSILRINDTLGLFEILLITF